MSLILTGLSGLMHPQGTVDFERSTKGLKVSKELLHRFKAGEVTKSDLAIVASNVDSVMKHLALPSLVDSAARDRFKQAGANLTKSYVAQILLEESVRFNKSIDNHTSAIALDDPVTRPNVQQSATNEQRVPAPTRKPIKVVSTFGLHI
jgi:hypothetical protein